MPCPKNTRRAFNKIIFISTFPSLRSSPGFVNLQTLSMKLNKDWQALKTFIDKAIILRLSKLRRAFPAHLGTIIDRQKHHIGIGISNGTLSLKFAMRPIQGPSSPYLGPLPTVIIQTQEYFVCIFISFAPKIEQLKVSKLTEIKDGELSD